MITEDKKSFFYVRKKARAIWFQWTWWAIQLFLVCWSLVVSRILLRQTIVGRHISQEQARRVLWNSSMRSRTRQHNTVVRRWNTHLTTLVTCWWWYFIMFGNIDSIFRSVPFQILWNCEDGWSSWKFQAYVRMRSKVESSKVVRVAYCGQEVPSVLVRIHFLFHLWSS